MCFLAFCRVSVKPIHTQIQPPVRTNIQERFNVVRYLHLAEVDGQYSVGVFVFPPFARMPLHDHPGMCVLSQVLYGALERTSLDFPRDEDNEANDISEDETDDSGETPMEVEEDSSRTGFLGSLWRTRAQKRLQTIRTPPNLPKGARRAYRKRVDLLEAPQCTVLYPYEGNLHQFCTGPNGAAVLDVLLHRTTIIIETAITMRSTNHGQRKK